MKNNIAIRLTNVSKRYTIHHEKPTLVEHLINGKNEEFWALKNINQTIKKGEKLGIIGSNGSGETTLLNIIGDITMLRREKFYKRASGFISLQFKWNVEKTIEFKYT